MKWHTLVHTYTFYPVRWATQKGDIFGVHAQILAQLGGRDFFCRCVRGPARVAQLKIRGGHHYSNFNQRIYLTKIEFCHEME